MKKILCLLFCTLGCLFMAFFGIAYIVFYNSIQIPDFITTIIWINAIIVVIAIVVGFGVIQISIDQWFPDGDGDVMTMKDRILIAIAVFITLICGGLFVLTILDYNLRGAPIQIFENIKLDMLMCILADTYVAFAYYQHFCVAAKQKGKKC